MNYNLQGKTWEGASDLPEVGTGVSATCPHSQEGHPERAGLHVCRPFPVGFFKDADSHVAPPSDLGTAVGAGDNALSRTTTGEEWLNGAKSIFKTAFVKQLLL